MLRRSGRPAMPHTQVADLTGALAAVTAVLDGDAFVVNGQKCRASNGGIAAQAVGIAQAKLADMAVPISAARLLTLRAASLRGR